MVESFVIEAPQRHGTLAAPRTLETATLKDISGDLARIAGCANEGLIFQQDDAHHLSVAVVLDGTKASLSLIKTYAIALKEAPSADGLRAGCMRYSFTMDPDERVYLLEALCAHINAASRGPSR